MKTLRASMVGRLVWVVSGFLLTSFFLTASAAPGDEHWSAQFGWPGPSGNTYAIVMHNGRLYASGLGSASTNVALEVWDGVQWSAMSQFYGSGLTAVLDLAFVGDTLYAAGIFTNVDGVAANGLAKWNGQSWSSIGFNGGAYSLAVDGTNLYVGGYFTNAGAVAVTNIARWDGSAWYPLGGGLGNSNYSIVYAVAASNGVVYAGGIFTNVGPLAVNNVARWDGTSWSAVGSGLSSTVYSLALNGTDLYAAGLFGTSGVAHWDGLVWSGLGSGFNAAVQSVAVFNNLVCAAGSFTNINGVSAARFAIWNGTSWSAVGSGLSSSAVRVCSTGTNVYIGGNFLLAGGIIADCLASWDGTNWGVIGTAGRIGGASTTVRAVAFDGVNLYAGCLLPAFGQTNANYIARFNGVSWFPLGSGLGGSSTPNVTSPTINTIVVNGNNVYVGGSFTSAGGVAVQNIARWDGTSWYAMGNPGGLVYSITVHSNVIYAAGSAQGLSGYADPFFSYWDGTNWQDALNFNINDTFFQTYLNDSVPGMDIAAFQDTNIYVGGHFNIVWHDPTFTYGTNCQNILCFDGTYGRTMGTGLNSNVVAMAVIGTNLYVSGPFTNAGGVTVSRIARWDGNSWWDVGGGVTGNGLINTLLAIGTNLYAGGTFTNIGGVPINHIAKWNGSTWSALGNGTIYSGASGPVLTLANAGSDLYVGGTFRMAGDKASFFVGRWNDQLNFDTPQLANPAWLTNRQFQARLFGISGMTNVIQASTNLTSWVPILTNTAGIYDFTDMSAPNFSRRFYRATLGP